MSGAPTRSAAMALALAATLAVSGCAKPSAEGAAKGAGRGAAVGSLAGAVGGVVTALIFGGDVGGAAARGAAWGASTGAVTGGIAGASAGAAEGRAEQATRQSERDAELARLKARIGEDAYGGLEALADCRHEIALGYARTAAKSGNANHSLAGTWLETVIHADAHDEPAARALFPAIVEKDPNVGSEAEVETKMHEALARLGEIRSEYDLPPVCPA